MNNFTFNTELFGLDVEVTAEVTPGERQTHTDPGFDTYCEITSVTHKEVELELGGLYYCNNTINVFTEVWTDLVEEAMEKALEAAKDDADERAAEARDY